jgi:hypothetical protein
LCDLYTYPLGLPSANVGESVPPTSRWPIVPRKIRTGSVPFSIDRTHRVRYNISRSERSSGMWINILNEPLAQLVSSVRPIFIIDWCVCYLISVCAYVSISSIPPSGAFMTLYCVVSLVILLPRPTRPRSPCAVRVYHQHDSLRVLSPQVTHPI